jgi:hypothetical protein
LKVFNEGDSFPPTAVAPGEFQIFPVTDTWLTQSETARSAQAPESRWLKSRWWE